MDTKESIKYLFPEISDIQLNQFEALGPLYESWNQKINLISRKDIQHIYLKHICHSLMIGKWISFAANSIILDLGTGGGFPGIPLSILFPEVKFHLVDSIRKKVLVVQDIVNTLGLDNVKTSHSRVEDLAIKYDFIVARAVAPAVQIIAWTKALIRDQQINSMPNGWILLKGGQLDNELKALSPGAYYEKKSIRDYHPDAYFAEKYIIYIQR